MNDATTLLESTALIQPTTRELKTQKVQAINQELAQINRKSANAEERTQMQQQRDQEYNAKKTQLESALGNPLNESTDTLIQLSLGDDVYDAAKKENNKYDSLMLNKLNLLLRTSEETQTAEKKGESSTYSLESNGKTIAVEGGKHEWNDNSYLDGLVTKLLNRDGTKVDTVFVELNPDVLAQIKSLPADTSPLDIVERYSGEQGYVAWQAIQQGVQVRTWDLSAEAQIETAAKVKEPRAVVEWMVGQSVDSLRRHYGDQIPAEIINGFKNRMSQLLQQTGIDLNTLSKLTVGGVEIDLNNPTTLLQITRTQAELVASPRTNEVSAYISQARNENAIREIYNAQQEGSKNISVTCGSEHALVWRDALTELYS